MGLGTQAQMKIYITKVSEKVSAAARFITVKTGSLKGKGRRHRGWLYLMCQNKSMVEALSKRLGRYS